MPRKAPRPCRSPGCPELVTIREGFCETHLAQNRLNQRHRHRRYDQKRMADADERKLSRFYRTSTWRKLREAYITEHPLCELCSQLGRITVGTVVDHIIERRDGGHDTDKDNLQTLCNRCHTVKTNEERKRRDNNEH